MKYAKPEVSGLGSALKAVQSDMLKPRQVVFDNAPIDSSKGTSPAYEADE
jgi:hypothetical protein